jgi:hypothetical protein
LTAEREIRSLADPSLTPITTRFLNFFRADGTPTPGNAAWGPKIHANLFGPGFGMGATAFSLGAEIQELAAINLDDTPDSGAGDFPVVQLLSDTGEPIRVVTGVADADAQPAGDIRIADWEFLGNSNIVIVGESRQEDDLVSRFGGDAPHRHAVYRVVDSQGAEVKAYSLVSSSTDAQIEMWHGAASTRNGFAIRFAKGGRSTVRLFDNAGNPTGEDIDIGELTGEEATSGGGRGDGTGFHGNGEDAYLMLNSGPGPAGGTQPWITVLNADGTLRYARAVLGEDRPESNTDRVDGAIHPDGRVIVAFDTSDSTLGQFRLVEARMFDRQGEPMGGTFYVSEKETDSTAFGESRRPRVAWRGNSIVIIWESANSPDTSNRVVATRFFEIAENGGGEFSLGVQRSDGAIRITWEGDGTLERSDTLGGQWAAVTGASSPYSVEPTGSQAFFRLRR